MTEIENQPLLSSSAADVNGASIPLRPEEVGPEFPCRPCLDKKAPEGLVAVFRYITWIYILQAFVCILVYSTLVLVDITVYHLPQNLKNNGVVTAFCVGLEFFAVTTHFLVLKPAAAPSRKTIWYLFILHCTGVVWVYAFIAISVVAGSLRIAILNLLGIVTQTILFIIATSFLWYARYPSFFGRICFQTESGYV